MGKDDTLAVIIGAELNGKKVECLLEELKRLKQAISKTIVNICSHKKQPMPDQKTSIEQQKKVDSTYA